MLFGFNNSSIHCVEVSECRDPDALILYFQMTDFQSPNAKYVMITQAKAE